MKVLYILPYVFYPADTGNKNLTSNLIGYTSKLMCCDVVMLVDSKNDISDSLEIVRKKYNKLSNVRIYRKPINLNKFIERFKAYLQGYHPSLGSYVSKDFKDWLSVNKKNYDLIHFDMVQTSLYVEFCSDVPTLLVSSDAYSMAASIGAKFYANKWDRLNVKIQSWFFKKIEKNIYPKFNVVCTVSEKDAQYLRDVEPANNIKRIKIGLAEEYSNLKINYNERVSESCKNILITGSLDHEGVARGVGNFLSYCLPSLISIFPELKIVLLGKNHHNLLNDIIHKNEKVTHIEYVDDYLQFLNQDWVYVYPQQCGTGLQTKVQQAMAVGLPVVGFEIAFGGLDVTSDKHCFICQNLLEFSERISKLLLNPDLRIEIGRCASNHITSNFSIDKIGKEMIEIYKTIVN